jgi:hypothetical protein
VADAMEALGQHMDEKPADELADVERHRRVAVRRISRPVVSTTSGRGGITGRIN